MATHPTTPPELKVLAVVSSTTPRMPSRKASTTLSPPPIPQQSPLTKPHNDGINTNLSPLLMPARHHSSGATRTPTSHPTKRFRSVSSSELALVDCTRLAFSANRWPNGGLRSTDVSLASPKGRSILSSTRSTLGRRDAHQSTIGRELNFETVGPRQQYRTPYSEPPRDRQPYAVHSTSGLVRPLGFHERIQREVDVLHNLRASQNSGHDPLGLDNLERDGQTSGPGAHLTIEGGETTETDSESEMLIMGSPLRQIQHLTTPARRRQRHYGQSTTLDLSFHNSSRSQPTLRTTSFTGMRRASTSMPSDLHPTISEPLSQSIRLPACLVEDRSDKGDTTETDEEMAQLANPDPLSTQPTRDRLNPHPALFANRPHSDSGESTASDRDGLFLHPLPVDLSNDPGDSDATDSLDEDTRQNGYELIRRCSGAYEAPSTNKSLTRGDLSLSTTLGQRPPRPPVTAKPAMQLQLRATRRKRPFCSSLDQSVTPGYDTDDEQPTAEYRLKPTPRLSPTHSSLGLTTTRIKRRKSTHFHGDHTASPTPFTRHRSQSFHPSSDRAAIALDASDNQPRRRASATELPPLPPIQRLQLDPPAWGPNSPQTPLVVKPSAGSVRSQRRILSGPPPLVQPLPAVPPPELIADPMSDSATESDDSAQPLGMAYRRLFQGHGDLSVLDNTGQFLQTIWSPLHPPGTGTVLPPAAANSLKRPIHSDEPLSRCYGLLGPEDDGSSALETVHLPKYRCMSANSFGAKRLAPRPTQPYALPESDIDHSNRVGAEIKGNDDEATDTESEPEAYLLRARAQLLEKLHAASTPGKSSSSSTVAMAASDKSFPAPTSDFRAPPMELAYLEQGESSSSSNRQLNFSAETSSYGSTAQRPSGRAAWMVDVNATQQLQLGPSSPRSQLAASHTRSNSSSSALPTTLSPPLAATLDLAQQPVLPLPKPVSTTANWLNAEATAERSGDQPASYVSVMQRFQSCSASDKTTQTLAESDGAGNGTTVITTGITAAAIADVPGPQLSPQTKGTDTLTATPHSPSKERESGLQRLGSAGAESNPSRKLPVTPKRSTRLSSTTAASKRAASAKTTPKAASHTPAAKPTTAAALTTALSPSSQPYPKTYDQFFKASQSPVALMAKLASATTSGSGHPGSPSRSATADTAKAISHHR
ncbi:hypothetical protein H4R35_006267 [Dimargaris xerosporica]|nr:hypothetical protein H4R35_006267 [Dimargaris xerosporica]